MTLKSGTKLGFEEISLTPSFVRRRAQNLIEMKQRNSANVLLSKFFKVYLPDESGDDLELPISVNSFLPKPLPRYVTVRSIYGKIWKLALRKCCGDDVERYALVDGWKRIVKDENLNGGDLLAFEFDGSKCFNFCIYKCPTMCKRLRRSSLQTHEVKTEYDEEEEEEEVRASDDVAVLEDDDDSDDMDYNYVDDNDASDNYVDDNDDVDSAAQAIDDDEGDFEADDDDDDGGIHYLDDPENPSFEITLNPNKKSQLRIPSYIIKDYDLNFSENITIVDPLVKKFGTLVKKIKIQKNGSVFLKGFGSVIRRNKVKAKDKMIFELKKTGNNLVHTVKINIING